MVPTMMNSPPPPPPLASSRVSPAAAAALPSRAIPGSYGIPLVGPLKDRLDYFWFQGPETFFRKRMESHKSTVFRTNMPPTFPFFLGVNPRVVCLLDCASFSALFDLSVVEKKNVLIGDYMPSLSFTGNTRVGVYQDPSEPQHGRVKEFCMDVLKRSSDVWVSEFLKNLQLMLGEVEEQLLVSGSSSSASYLLPLQKYVFRFLTKSIAGADPTSSPDIGDQGHIMLDKWLALQLLPTTKVGVIPQPLEELLLHSFPFPSFLVGGGYRKLYAFIEREGEEVIRRAQEEYGLTKEEAIHNILFVIGFNAFGGFSIFLPSLITTLGKDRTGLGDRLREEVRGVMAATSHRLGFAAVKEMELVRSTVYEVLRLNPPVPLQYARAKTDFVLNSHDCSYRVDKGELLCGYQPLAMKDPAVFEDPESFVPDRFKDNKKLLDYLFWSNGPETGNPTKENKQCAAKDYVVATACLMVAYIFSNYDTLECDESSGAITKLTKAARGTTTTTTS